MSRRRVFVLRRPYTFSRHHREERATATSSVAHLTDIAEYLDQRLGGRPLEGVPIGQTVRNSTKKQVDNWSEVEQVSFERRLTGLGADVVLYDERGTSGRDLSKRKVAQQMLADVKAGKLRGIAAYDVKRLTRNEFGIDGGVIARDLIDARAVLVTNDQIYELWKEGDLLKFQFECMLAGIDIRGMKRQFWRGRIARAEHEPFFQIPPIGYRGRIVEYETSIGHSKVKRVPEKDPAQAEMMRAITELMDECTTLGEVCLKLNDRGLQRIGKRQPYRGQKLRWERLTLWRMLQNPVYRGEWEYGYTVDKRNTVWEGFRDRELKHRVEDLAYWTPGKVAEWHRRFGHRDGYHADVPTRRARRHDYKLAGVLSCPVCHTPMVGAGNFSEGNLSYKCPNRSDPSRCVGSRMIGERQAFELIKGVMPGVLARVPGLAEEAERLLAEDQTLQDLEATLETRKRQIDQASKEWMGLPPPRPKSLGLEIQAMEREVEVLEARVAESRERRTLDQDALNIARLLGDDPGHLFDRLKPDLQKHVIRLLMRGVEIRGVGWASGMAYQLVAHRTLLDEQSCRETLAQLGNLFGARG